MKQRSLLLWGLVLGILATSPGMAQKKQKLAQSGFQFLTVVSDARAAGMGNAVNSLPMASGSLFFNPACMAEMASLVEATFSTNRWIADIRHTTMSVAVSPFRGELGVLGFSFQTVDYGDRFYGTVIVPEAYSPKGYINTGEISPTALAVGVGYAKKLTDRFSVGGQVRAVRQDFGELVVPATDTTREKVRYRNTPVAFDFGTLFKTGFKSLAFGMSVRNFSREVKYIRERFELPLLFTLGIHADLMDWIQPGGPEQSLLISVDAKHYRSHAEQVCVGVDYRLMKILSCRIGYITHNDENRFSYGIGLSWEGLSIDYAYSPYGVFDSVNRVTIRFAR